MYTVEQVQGDGEWTEVSDHKTLLLATLDASKRWKDHLAVFGGALRHTRTHALVGRVRIKAPDGYRMSLATAQACEHVQGGEEVLNHD